MKHTNTLLWVLLFAVAFAFIEAAVVVYLRAIYHPEGFSFPLTPISSHHLAVELTRELSTILMLVSIGMLAGRSRWQKFAYFMIAFGVWDIFYYFWLKLTLNWPASLFDWDILFLIPAPWIGPVIAPVLISLLMTTGGILILKKEEREGKFSPGRLVWTLAILGSSSILYSFTHDLDATLRLQIPKPYRYELLAVGLASYIISLLVTLQKTKSSG